MVSLGCVLKTVLGKAYPWQQRVIVVPTSVFQSLSMNLVIAWADPKMPPPFKNPGSAPV